MTDSRPLAFVIMPFDSALDAVYTDLIKSTLESTGFRVQRADDLLTSRNILDDIVEKLAASDFIIADLTDLNPNVFYELGLAHSINGRVLMITQDVSSLPFDLQSYRVLEYDTHFSRFKEAKSRLSELASAAIRGELPYGSPVSDFKRTRSGTITTPDMRSAEESGDVETSSGDTDDEDADTGQLDYMLGMIESASLMTDAIDEISSATEHVGAQITESTSILAGANDINNPVLQMRTKYAAVRQVGLNLDEYARFLDEKNTQYEFALVKYGTCFEAALTLRPPESDEARSGLQKLLDNLSRWMASIAGSRKVMSEFAETIRTTPRIEKYSTKAMNAAFHQLERLVGNLEQTESTLARVSRVISRLLDDVQ